MNCVNCGGALRPDVKFCPRCGTPAQQQPAYTPPPEPIRTSWAATPAAAPPRRKSRAGKILLIVLGVFLLLAGGAAVAVYYGVRYFTDSVKSSEPYRIAVKELHDNPVAAGTLGGIKSTGFPIGTYNTNADGTGNAAFTMSVEGGLQSGQYVVVLTRQSGQWRITSAIVRLSGGEVVTLVGEGTGDAAATPDPAAGIGGADVPPAPPAPGAPAPPPKPRGNVVSAGVLDGKTVRKPDPAYPAIAKAARASGTVTVQVTVNEQGDVIEARAVGGHPLLRAAAEAAARQAKLTPTLLSGKPVKVSGVLTYEFKPE